MGTAFILQKKRSNYKISVQKFIDNIQIRDESVHFL